MATSSAEASVQEQCIEPRYYMPFYEKQKMVTPVVCQGALVMLELNASSLWRYGSRAWADVQQFPDHIQLMRLFMFVLNEACVCNATVYIETLVQETDHVQLHHSILENTSVVTGYRLWIPMDPGQAISFGKSVAVTLSGENMVSLSTQKSYKIRKTNPPKHKFMAPINDVTTLQRLCELYFVGHVKLQNIRMELLQETGGAAAEVDNTDIDDINDDDDDGLTPSISSEGADRVQPRIKTVVEILSADYQFHFPLFQERAKENDTYKVQTRYDSYVRMRESDGTLMFFPKETIRNSGLLRQIHCGKGSRTLKYGSDLLTYLRPEFRPTDAEMIDKLRVMTAAHGIYPDFKNKRVSDLIDLHGDNDITAHKFHDPHSYSAIVVKGDETDSTDYDINTNAMRKYYYVTASLKDKNRVRLEHAALHGDSKRVKAITAQIVQDTTLLYSEKNVPGVPPMYHKLFSSAEKHLLDLKSTDPSKQFLREHFWRKHNKSKNITGFTHFMMGLVVRARNMLLMLPQQLPVFVFLWLRHSTVTWNIMYESFFGVLAGPSDTGKTEAGKRVASCICPHLIWSSDGGSQLAMTVATSKDMTFHLIEEFKNVGKSENDSESDMATKLLQSQISNGIITYEAKMFNHEKQVFEMQTTRSILRTCTVTNTNIPENMAKALKSRHTAFDVVEDTEEEKRRHHVNANIAIALRDGSMQQRFQGTFQACLQTYSCLFGQWTGLEAVGAIPPIDSTLFIVFESMLPQFLPEKMPPRRTLAIKQFAQSIMVVDLVTMWWSRGLGEKYNYDPVIRTLFYASCSYLAPHHIIAAYTQLEQTTTKTEQIKEMLGLIKGQIIMENQMPAQVEEYYVLSYNKRSVLTTDLSRLMPRLGKGIVERLFNTIASGLTNGVNNIKTSYYSGTERLLIHKQLISKIRTPVETKILLALYNTYKQPGMCSRGYEDETKLVFRTDVLKSLTGFGDKQVMEHEVLEVYKMAPQQIEQGLSFLRQTRNEDDLCMFQEPMMTNVCKYVPVGTDGAVPSTLRTDRYKLRHPEYKCLVIDEALLFPNKSEQTTRVDQFLTTFLAISDAKYIGTKKTFAGINTNNKGGGAVAHCIGVPLDYTTKITVRNPMYMDKTTAQIVLGREKASLYATADDRHDPTMDIDESYHDSSPSYDSAAAAKDILPSIGEDMLADDNYKEPSDENQDTHQESTSYDEEQYYEDDQSDDTMTDEEMYQKQISVIQEKYFPYNKKHVNFTHTSNIVSSVAQHMIENIVCVPEELRKDFYTAHHTY